MRKLAYWIAVGLVLIGGLGGPGLVASANPADRAVVVQSVAPRAPAVPPYKLYLPLVARRFTADFTNPFGVTMYGNDDDASGRSKMQEAGSGWFTVNFSWQAVEPTAPVGGVHTYHWNAFDPIVMHAQTAGMSLFVLFIENPAWAAALGGGPVDPEDVVNLNAVVAAAAERYDGDGLNDAPGSPIVRYWSFYAEPDNGSLSQAQNNHKGYWGHNPSGYADMIAGVSTAMHAANPQVVVTIGGLAYDFFEPFGIFVESFLGGVLDALNAKTGGATAYLDAIAFHFFPINPARWPTIREKALEIKGIMNARGAGSLPLIVPEMGYWSEAVPSAPNYNSTEPQQARAMVQMYVRGLSVGIQHMSWLGVFDNGSGLESHGLFRGANLNDPKPSYFAYDVMAAELNHPQYLGPRSSPGVEGYDFLVAGQTKSVVWATQASASATFFQTCLRRADYMGGVTTPIADGNPAWDQDAIAGRITLQVLQNQPLYVSHC